MLSGPGGNGVVLKSPDGNVVVDTFVQPAWTNLKQTPDGMGNTPDMLVTARDRVQKLKADGRSLQEMLAAKPTADLDKKWGKGFMMPNDFVTIVYNTL